MFNVSNHLAKIASCTNVSEKHGKERAPAISIGLYLVGSGSILDDFDPVLRLHLYRKPQPSPGALPHETEELSELRFPFMRNLAWSNRYAGYQLRFRIGATGKDDVLLSDCTVKDIRFVTQEGGNVGVQFKVSAHPMNELDHGKIAQRLQQEIFIDLIPPEKPVDLFTQDEADEEGDPFAGSDLATDDTRIDA